MAEELPVEDLALNLLALADAASELSDATRNNLAEIVDSVEPEADRLSLISTRLHIKLLNEVAFREARSAWSMLIAERYQLDVSKVLNTLPDSIEILARGVEGPLLGADTGKSLTNERVQALHRIASFVRIALRDPTGFALNKAALRELAATVDLKWPRKENK